MKTAEMFANQLKEQMLNLTDDLLEILPNERDVFAARLYFEFQPAINLMEGFVKHVIPRRDYIKNRDERYFTENGSIFGSLPQNKVDHFKNMFLSGRIGDDEKQVIWDYFDVFLTLAENFEKLI
jgi:hypothetical protein